MGWILFGLFALVAIGWISGKKGHDHDDFAGDSMKSYFLMEEFVDDPDQDDNNRDHVGYPDNQEEDWSEDEWD
jgi:hypothetical protein